MKTPLTKLALLSLILCAPFTVLADAPTAPDAVRDVIAEQSRTFDVPGIAVAAVHDGEVAWVETYGTAGDSRPVDAATTFNVASLTKPIFAMLVMQLVADEKFSLDEPLAKYWVDPDVEEDPRHELLTARLALSHQSGLPNWRGRNPLAFQFTPGERHEYSGEGFEYVRRAIERATGKSLSDLMAKYVTRPAAMPATQFGWSDALESSIVTGFREDGSPLDGSYLRQRGPNAAANTFTTIGDIARFAAWVSRGADLSKSMLEPMTTPQAIHSNPVEYFSIGWRLVDVSGRSVLMHDGREGGLRTLMIVDPESHNGLVILTNSSNGELITRSIIESALPDGDALNKQVDRDVWVFMTGQPPQMQAGLLGFIARSPTFTAKLLYAVQSSLVIKSGVSDKVVDEASSLVDRVVRAHHAGDIDAEALAAQLALLDGDPGDGVALLNKFDAGQAAAWRLGLSKLLE